MFSISFRKHLDEKNSLFQALGRCGGLQKQAGDEGGLVGKKERLSPFSLPDPAHC